MSIVHRRNWNWKATGNIWAYVWTQVERVSNFDPYFFSWKQDFQDFFQIFAQMKHQCLQPHLSYSNETDDFGCSKKLVINKRQHLSSDYQLLNLNSSHVRHKKKLLHFSSIVSHQTCKLHLKLSYVPQTVSVPLPDSFT